MKTLTSVFTNKNIFLRGKYFSNKIISIPNNLKSKNYKKSENSQVYENPIQKILKNQKLVENNKNEIENFNQKNINRLYIEDISKKMNINYNKFYSKSNEKNIIKIKEFCTKALSYSEINTLIFQLQKLLNNLNDEEVEKNQALFKIFLDKIIRLTQSDEINQTLINLLCEINLREFKISDLFYDLTKNSDRDLEEILENHNSEFRNDSFESKFHYTSLTSNSTNFMKLEDTRLNDIATTESHPEENFIDSFLIDHQYKFTKPLIIQSDPNNKTKISLSNYVYFMDMPFIYPVLKPNNPFKKEENLDNYVLTQLDSEIILKNNISVEDNDAYTNFVIKFLKQTFYTDHPDISILNYKYKYTDNITSRKNSYQDIKLIDDVSSYMDEFFSETIHEDPSFIDVIKSNKKYSTKSKSSLIVNSDFTYFKNEDIEKDLKSSVKGNLYCSGLMKYKSYDEKQIFLKSPAKVFGIHIQGKKVNFFDADFCNVLKIKIKSRSDNLTSTELLQLTNTFSNLINKEVFSLNELINLINIELKGHSFSGTLLEKPSYTDDKLEFDEIKKGESIYIRTNSFIDLIEIFEILNTVNLKKILECSITKPQVRYYNEHFISGFDLVLQSTIKDFNSMLSMKSG